MCDDLDEAKRLSWSGQRFKGIIVDWSLHMLVDFCYLFIFIFPILNYSCLQFIYFSFYLVTVVTTNGILLTKSGTMTGGTSGGMEARSHKWDDKKIEGQFECDSEYCLLCSVSVSSIALVPKTLPLQGLRRKKKTWSLNWISLGQ